MDPAEPNPLPASQYDPEPIQSAASIKPESKLVRALKNISPFTYCFAAVLVISLVALAYFVLQNLSLKSQLGMISFKWPWTSATCTYQGTEFKPGESVPSVDGCNSCSCSQDGQVMCTLMACENNIKQSMPEPVSNWQVFKNENYRYQISYPADWETSPSISKGEMTQAIGMHGSELAGRGATLAQSADKTTMTLPFIQIETMQYSPQEFKDFLSFGHDQHETITFAGQTAYRFSLDYDEEGQRIYGEAGTQINIDTYDESNQFMHQIICAEPATQKGLCTQILSTFEFIDESTTNTSDSEKEQQITQAVVATLAKPYMLNPNENPIPGIELLSVKVVKNNVTLDFNKQLVSAGPAAFEDVFSQISNAIHPIIQGDGIDPIYPDMLLSITIEGKPSNEFF